MSNEYYSRNKIDGEFQLIQDAFDLMPTLEGNGDEIVKVNAAGTALETASLMSSFPTGIGFLTIATTAPAGWIMMNDGSIGNAASGGTTRANADTEDLYTLFWNNVIDTWAPVSTGRGASAAADFAANKTITLTRQLGRAICISGAGSGLTSRVLGEYLGAETHTLTIAEMPAHTHSYTSPAINSQGASPNATYGAVTADNTGSTGGGDPHANMQPSAFWNVMIKL